MLAPPFEFVARAFAPVLRRMGARIEVDIQPGTLAPVDCIDRGALRSVSATARRLLPEWPEEAFAVRQLPDELGPGNVLLL